MKDDRDYDSLARFIDTQMSDVVESSPAKVKPQVSTGPLPNPSGINVPLTSETFNQHISLVPSKSMNTGWFVKFFVPWCSHCQHMAEAWTELARDMKGKLNIGEVNCDVETRLCKDVKLRGYPTLIFFKGGERVEYDGLRGLGDLVSFAGKAVQYATFKNALILEREYTTSQVKNSIYTRKRRRSFSSTFTIKQQLQKTLYPNSLPRLIS
jgi:thiol-disulfide isomerase/thioredoxin